MLINTGKPLRLGSRVDLSIDWPVRLEGGAQLSLNVLGTVTRSELSLVALRIINYEFRIRARRGGHKKHTVNPRLR